MTRGGMPGKVTLLTVVTGGVRAGTVAGADGVLPAGLTTDRDGLLVLLTTWPLMIRVLVAEASEPID